MHMHLHERQSKTYPILKSSEHSPLREQSDSMITGKCTHRDTTKSPIYAQLSASAGLDQLNKTGHAEKNTAPAKIPVPASPVCSTN